MSLTPSEFALFCVQQDAPAAVLAAAEKFGVSKADLVAYSGFSETTVDAWFQAAGIDLDQYLGQGSLDWGTQDVLASAGLSQADARAWLMGHIDQPPAIAQAVLHLGANAEVLAQIVGCAQSDVIAYFDHAGFGDYFSYFS